MTDEPAFRRRRTVLLAGGAAVLLVGAAVLVAVRRGDGSGGELGRDGWTRTRAEPAAAAVSGADGGPLRAVVSGGEDLFEISSDLVEPSGGQRTVLDGSDAPGARPVAVTADGPESGWVVVGGDGWDSPLTAWSSLDAPTAGSGGGALPRAPGIALPNSDLGTLTVAAGTAGDHQVIAASDGGNGRIVVWARRGGGGWERSTIDPLESARSTPAPEPGLADSLRVVQDGDRFLLAAVTGDPAILSLWASEPFPAEGPVSGWERTAAPLDGEPACVVGAFHRSAAGVLLAWAPLGPDGCRDQEELRFVLLHRAGSDVEELPTLDPEAGDAIVRDAVALEDGTIVAVGSRGDPPHGGTADNESVPAVWIRPADDDWEPRPLDEPGLSTQLDNVATTVSLGAAADAPDAEAVDELLITTRRRDPGAAGDAGLDLWTWQRRDQD